MRWKSIAVLALGCGLSGCGGQDGGGQPKLKQSLDLSHVIGFAIAGTTGSAAAGLAPPFLGDDAGPCSLSTLYAIQDDGEMVVTTVTESGSGTEPTCTTMTQTERASAIFDTPGYEVIAYDSGFSFDCASYVVLRKSDGALFCTAREENGRDVAPGRVQGGSEVLYLGGGPSSGFGKLVRLDMSASPPQATTVDDEAVTTDHIITFDVNSANDALANGSFGIRVFKDSGGLQNIDAVSDNFQWLNPSDGEFYYSSNVPAGNETYQLSASYASTLVGNGFRGSPSAGFALATATQAYLWETDASSGAIAELLPSAAGSLCQGSEVGLPAVACAADADCIGTCGGQPGCSETCLLGGAQHVVPGVSTIKSATGTGSQLYVLGTDAAGNGTILGIDVSQLGETACCTTTGCCPYAGCCSSPATPTTLLPAGEYSLSAISLSEAGELTFAGLRNSDGASVLGNCVAGACTVLNASAPMVTALQRIN